MPTILETIREYDPDILAMIAEQWGFDPQTSTTKDYAGKIATRLQQADTAWEIMEALPQPEQSAIRDLCKRGGRINWDQFTRKYGVVREMGVILREKERPDRHPVSVTEHLFYLGLTGRAFFKTQSGLEEFAYLPDEFLQIFNFPSSEPPHKIEIPSSSEKGLAVQKWTDGIIDHAASLLAELRKMKGTPVSLFIEPDICEPFLKNLLADAEIIHPDGSLNSDRMRDFLKRSRPQALSFLFQTWQKSATINEIELVKTLQMEGGWKNNPEQTRTKILQVMEKIPPNQWMRVEDFILWFYRHQPDFLRSGGEYDAWLIKNAASGAFLRGFEHWGNVEGIFLKHWLQGPAYWLGLVEIGIPYEDTQDTHFRISDHAADLIHGKCPSYKTVAVQQFLIEKSGKIIIDRSFARDLRYQVARFCEWEHADHSRYFYRVTPASLANIRQQGLKHTHLLALLQEYGKKPIPKNLLVAIQRWEKNQIEAQISQPFVVQLKSPKILEALMASPAAPYIIETLNETTARIQPEGIQFIQAALLDMGILSDIRTEV